MLLYPLSTRSSDYGDLRILRKIGGGKMGVVYEAEQQTSLGPVALEVIRGGTDIDE